MTQHQTTIDGYTVDLDTDMDGEGVTGCWVSKRLPSGVYSSSLARLQDQGGLAAGDYSHDLSVAEATIDKISAWAEQKGY